MGTLELLLRGNSTGMVKTNFIKGGLVVGSSSRCINLENNKQSKNELVLSKKNKKNGEALGLIYIIY